MGLNFSWRFGATSPLPSWKIRESSWDFLPSSVKDKAVCRSEAPHRAASLDPVARRLRNLPDLVTLTLNAARRGSAWRGIKGQLSVQHTRDEPPRRTHGAALKSNMNEKRAFFGTIALSTVSAVRLGLQLLVLPILARILGPDAFGLLGLAIPFILLASMLCDAGMGNALIRHPNPSWQLESTVFWLSLGMGIGLTVLVSFFSGIIARGFSQPNLSPVLAALSVILALGGGLAVPNARITRSRHFGIFAAGDLVSAILSSATAIYAALHGFGVWSLVIQQLVLWITKAAWLFPVSNFRPAFFCKPSLAKPFLHFGLNSVAANIADFIGKSVPSLVVGGTLGVTAVGHYSMAYQLARVPEIVISGPVYLSTFTAAARFGHWQVARPFVLRSLRIMVLSLSFLFGGIGITADLGIHLLLGEKWVDTGPTLAALAPAGFCLCLYSFIGAVLLGFGNSGRQFRLTLLRGLAMFAGSVAGTHFGVAGVAAGLSLGAATLGPFYFQAVASELRLPALSVLSTLTSPLIATIAMICVVFAVRIEITDLNEGLQLMIAAISGALSFAVAIILAGARQFVTDFQGLGAVMGKVQPVPQPEMSLTFDGVLLAEREK